MTSEHDNPRQCKLLDIQPPQDAIVEAVTGLRDLAQQHADASRFMLDMVFRLLSPDRPMRATIYLTRYVEAGKPSADAVADIIRTLEASLPAEWQERRAKAHHAIVRNKQARKCGWGREAAGIRPHNWDGVMFAARKRRDVLGAAIAACEGGGDAQDKIAETLAEYLEGKQGIHHVEECLQRHGLAVDGAKVVPFVPKRRAGR